MPPSAGRGDIEIDARGLTFCDVSGLHTLLAAAHRGGIRGAVRLHGALAAVVRLLDVTDTRFRIDGPVTAPALRLVPASVS
ncbi:STAS domain-containing protein [Streptomyces sp. WAC01526]|uniref:STAS domain-containing protein n=1 Tax=Streptomyces sp. WAC01526 TaxID=2588709 RepID=UPI0011DF0835